MAVHGAYRASGLVVSIAALALLLVWFGSLGPDPAAWALPGGGELARDYDGMVGEEVEIYGRVISTDPVVITGEYDGRRLELTIRGVAPSVERGQYLHVYGRVLPDHEIRALGSVVYPARGIRYTYAVSAVSLLWVVVRFFDGWRVNLETLAFERRDESLLRRLVDGGSDGA